jgi:tetratricopeptide (TPR) repeat protein
MIGEAIDQFRQAIVLRPDYAIAYNYLAWIYATSVHDRYRNGREAVALATRACELTEFKNAYFLDTLAAAFAESGDFKRALLYQEKALAMSQEKEQAALRARLRRYQSGQAYRCY